MSLFQKGIGSNAVTFAIRPRLIVPRTPLRRVRQPRRYNSSTPEQPPAQGKPTKDGSTVNTNTSNASSNPPPQSSSSGAQQPSTASAAVGAAGAATTPAGASEVVRSRGFKEILKASPLGRFGRWYAGAQARKPYTVQVWSSIVIYLCGDLSAQLLFPEKPSPKELAKLQDGPETKEEDDTEKSFFSTYDPWRTARHLVVGGGSSIPSYHW